MNDKVAKEIISNYESYNESNRLTTPYGFLEELHTRELILRFINPLTTTRVLDIGGGTGPYSFWLSSLGFEVHLSDIVPKHVEIARRNAGDARVASIQIEDARNLSYEDSYADCILQNGPLYHLVSKIDRELVLRECRRVLKPDGMLLAFAIGRLSGLMYSLNSGSVFSDDYFDMVKVEMVSGIRTDSQRKNKTFLEAYFHNAKDLSDELLTSGLKIEKIIGVLGQSWNTGNLEEIIREKPKVDRLMEVARLMEELPDFSPKILGVGRKMAD